MQKTVSVKFKDCGKLYYFAPGREEYKKNMKVIVETTKGLECATVVEPLQEVADEKIVAPLKPIIRIATDRDLEQLKRNEERKAPAMETCRKKIIERGLDMKLIDCEFAFDGSKVVFFFTSENRVDFRELVKDLASEFHIRIELRQVGIRDEAKMLGGIAPCGRVCCCVSCMPEFKKVSIKMAKTQGLSLNPTKISGLCGRLMCCLAYENDYYAEVGKDMPKVGSEADSAEGTGTVIGVNMIKREVKLKIPVDGVGDYIYRDFPVEEITFKKASPPVEQAKKEPHKKNKKKHKKNIPEVDDEADFIDEE